MSQKFPGFVVDVTQVYSADHARCVQVSEVSDVCCIFRYFLWRGEVTVFLWLCWKFCIKRTFSAWGVWYWIYGNYRKWIFLGLKWNNWGDLLIILLTGFLGRHSDLPCFFILNCIAQLLKFKRVTNCFFILKQTEICSCCVVYTSTCISLYLPVCERWWNVQFCPGRPTRPL